MSNTQQTLAQMIRAKYPNTYDDMDDATLEKNVLAKYPQYGDLPKTTSAQPTTEQGLESALGQIRHGGGVGEMADPSHPAHGMLRQALSDIESGDYSKGAHGLISAAAEFLKPTAPATIAAAPVASALGFGTAAASSKIGQTAATKLGATPEQAQFVGDIAGLAGGAGASKLATLPGAAAKFAPRLYQSALKPGPGTYSTGEVASMVGTGLREAIPVSEGGIAKIGALVDDLNRKVQAQIASRPGATIDPQLVAQRTGPTAAKFATQVNAGEDVAAIKASTQQFLSEQGAKPGIPAVPAKPTGLLDQYGQPIMGQATPAVPPTPAPPMSATRAQQLKSGTYTQLGGKAYGELKSATIESQKALARGIKEELASQFPEISDLNARESKLLGLDEALQRAVRRIDNSQIIGIGTPIVAGGAGAITKSTYLGAAAAMVKAVLDDPMLKSKLAIAMSRAGQGATPITQANARIAAYSAALAGAANAGFQQNPTSGPGGAP